MDREDAKAQVERELNHFLRNQDPLLMSLKGASIGVPVLVRNIFKQASYWLVPLLVREQLTGFARVLLNGTVAHIGKIGGDSKEATGSSWIITGIDKLEAARRAEERICHDCGELATDPIFVHDGPIGREAWMVEVVKDGNPIKWIFVTPSFIYDRPAGKSVDENLE
jgi:hypothetical protein